MIKLNDYLYNGDTVLKILSNYTKDLRQSAVINHNPIDLVHCNFLLQISEMLQHNDFLTIQSQQLREFYKVLADKYPYLAFTFRGRIKSLIFSWSYQLSDSRGREIQWLYSRIYIWLLWKTRVFSINSGAEVPTYLL